MRTKSLFLGLLTLVASAFLAGCSDDDTPERVPDPELTLTPDAPIVFAAGGGDTEIAVTTNMEAWKAESDRTWCKVTMQKGKFTIMAAPNETTEPMPIAVVTVTASTGDRSISRKLQVEQEAGAEKIADLSGEGTANCYLVAAAGKYGFDATVRGNGATTVRSSGAGTSGIPRTRWRASHRRPATR